MQAFLGFYWQRRHLVCFRLRSIAGLHCAIYAASTPRPVRLDALWPACFGMVSVPLKRFLGASSEPSHMPWSDYIGFSYATHWTFPFLGLPRPFPDALV